MSKKPTPTSSRVKTRSGEVEGIFTQAPIPITEASDFVENYPQHKNAVMDRIDEMESIALEALRKSGYNDWNEKILLVDGERYNGDIPNDYWEEATSPERRTEILKALGIQHRRCERTTSGSAQKAMSLGYFANLLRKHCGSLRNNIENNNFWGTLHRMSIAEDCLCSLKMSLMEADYIRGKRQRGRYDTDWDKVLAAWKRSRPQYKYDSECDRAMAKEFGIPSSETVKSQRQMKMK